VTSTVLPGVAAFIGTFAGGAATYVVARRKSSGRIRTSEAEILWEASESIRHDLTAALKTQSHELAAVKAAFAAVNAQLAALHAENDRLADEVAALRLHLEP
jgi:hypothetical protein